MSDQPLVSIICLSYNHERFVKEALMSVFQQTYKNIEIIVVDDASTDNSKEVITDLLKHHPEVKFMALEKNIGNCKAFNQAYAVSSGEFIIDLAADDVLLPQRVAQGVKALLNSGEDYGVNFTNAEVIDEQGDFMKHHYPINQERKSTVFVPSGDVFKDLVARYFICPPTMMYTRALVEYLGGYDENLTYEDFDLWIRSSRVFKYAFTDEILVKRRMVQGSKRSMQFKIRSPHLRTTYTVMQKAKALISNEAEAKAFKSRVYYEVKVALRYLDFPLAYNYLRLLQ
ncbi:glycosyltransferase [Fulvivirga maritima]|uniref:glycosyltransferase family 2 protein n=1 Tax=Fulvivirga maritima TaxID=2904247 RepID=UPI001F39156F|nr:glycosyltransferase [Fulvivirga maritima]UII29310.1 glycosyltransferase [Fulvivirga maritima]